MARTKKVVRLFPTIDLVAAACAAQRVNGQYVKQLYELGDKSYSKTNRELVYKFLDDQSNIIPLDYKMAEDIKQFYKGYTFKILSGDFVSDFDRNILKILEDDTCVESGYNIAILASIPSVYLKAKQRHDIDVRVRSSDGGYIGTVGGRYNLEIEILKSNFSEKYGIWFVTAMTSSNQALFFSYKQELTVGNVLSITGTVKRHNNNQTQLNRVKVN